DDIGSVNLGEVEVVEILDELRDAAAGRVDFHRNRDGIAVVFNNEDDGKLLVRGGVERFPELALRGRAFADGDVDDLIALELNVAPLTVVAFVFLRGFGMAGEVASRLGTPH